MTSLFTQLWFLMLVSFVGGSIIALVAIRFVFPSAEQVREQAARANKALEGTL